MARERKAISPVIATVIIVAVAIAISIAVAGWLFGMWTGIAGGTPQIAVTNTIAYDNGTVLLYVVNQGSGADNLLRVELSDGNDVYALTPNVTVIDANFKGWIKADPVDATVKLNPGQSVTIKLYFEKSGPTPITTTVQPAP